MNDYNEAFKNLIDVSKRLNETVSPQFAELQTSLRLFSQRMNEIIKSVTAQISSTDYMRRFLNSLGNMRNRLKKQKQIQIAFLIIIGIAIN